MGYKTKIPDFDDLLFESRNKDYGAYQLRKKYKSVVFQAVIVASLITCSALIIPFLIKNHSNNEFAIGSRSITIQLENLNSPIEDFYVPSLQSPPETKIIIESMKYVAPEIVDTIIHLKDLASTDAVLAASRDSSFNSIGNGNSLSTGNSDTGFGDAFLMVEIMPSFKGGNEKKFREWVRNRTNYPQEAVLNNIKGTVYLSFIVEKDGSVSNVTVVKGVHPVLDNEAKRIISESPRWSPGIQRGQPVRVRFLIPIAFSG